MIGDQVMQSYKDLQLSSTSLGINIILHWYAAFDRRFEMSNSHTWIDHVFRCTSVYLALLGFLTTEHLN